MNRGLLKHKRGLNRRINIDEGQRLSGSNHLELNPTRGKFLSHNLVACHVARYVSVSAIYAASVVVGRSRDKLRFMGPRAPFAPWRKGRTLFRGCERIPGPRSTHEEAPTRRNRRGKDSWSREEADLRKMGEKGASVAFYRVSR